MTLVLAKSSDKPAIRTPADSFEENLLEKELEAEICQRFVRLSCEKMLASRNSRGGARLHRNLLILHLLRKARYSTKMLPYECSSLLKRHPQSNLANVSHRIISSDSNQVEQDQNSCKSTCENKSQEHQTNDLKDSTATTTLIVLDTNEERDDEPEAIEYMSYHKPHVSRPLYQDQYHQYQEEEEANVELDVELEYNSSDNSEKDISSPMEDVNIKVEEQISIFAQSSVEEDKECEQEEDDEIIDVVGNDLEESVRVKNTDQQSLQQLLSPIGSHLKSSKLRSYSSSCSLQDVGTTKLRKESNSDVTELGLTTTSRKTTSKLFNTSSSSSLFSFSNSSSTNISYQYESQEEPLEYKVHDRHENSEDYGLIDFSRSTSSSSHSHHHSYSRQRNAKHHTTTSSPNDSLCHYTNDYRNDEEEFQKQQRRHFSGRLYERCNFTRMQPGPEYQFSKSRSNHKTRESVHRNSSTLLPFNSLSNASQMSRLTTSKGFQWKKEADEEAIEEGTDAAELDLDCPPLPLRSSSDWLHPIQRQLLPNIQSIMSTPLSPPICKHMKKTGELNKYPCDTADQPKDKALEITFFHVNNTSESIANEVGKEEEEEDEFPMLEEESTSPPKIFYCSPPSSPPPPESEGKSAHLLVFHYSTDEEEEDFQAPMTAYEEEEGFFEEEEEEDGEQENRSHIRKRKTTGNGAGRLAVLEKRPCCEDGEEESSDGDSGMDVNGVLDSAGAAANEPLKSRSVNAAKPDGGDQTVPVAAMLNNSLMFV